MTKSEPDRWRREGLLLGVAGPSQRWRSHASLPTALPLSERLWRIYFAIRDEENRARMAAVDVDPGAEMRILATYLDPMLEPAPPGAFDHEAFAPSAALVVDGRVWLYYTGLSVRRDVRFQYSIGLAVSDDGLSFRRAATGPVVSTGPWDPYYTSAPAILRGRDGWRMWYASGTGWRPEGGRLEPTGEIRTVTSDDGLIWTRSSSPAVPAREPWLYLGRPSPLATPDGIRLWFSRRRGDDQDRGSPRQPYRLAWGELDAAGTSAGPLSDVRFENPPAKGDFDEHSQAYPCVLPFRDDLIMFYNGNDFGAHGFGWARLKGGAALTRRRGRESGPLHPVPRS